MANKTRAALLIVSLLVLGGCASMASGSAIAMPTPSPGDTEGQIMSVTGTGFTICAVTDLTTGDSTRYLVDVCGSVSRARTVLTTQFPQLAKITDLRAYQSDDGGPHPPQDLVMQFWIMRTNGPGFRVVSSEILGDDMIDVGIDGDLKAAKAALDREFPGRTKVHAQAPGVDLVGNS